MLYSEFQNKEVVNMCDCKKLGRVIDFEMNECQGQICSLHVAKVGKWCKFFSDEDDMVISYSDIKQIGPDIILVEVATGKKSRS